MLAKRHYGTVWRELPFAFVSQYGSQRSSIRHASTTQSIRFQLFAIIQQKLA